MNTPSKVIGFLAALAIICVTALGVGNAVGPVATPWAESADHDMSHDAEPTSASAELPGGLMVSQDGYTLRPTKAEANPGADVPVSFTIEGPDGRRVTDYDVEHDKQLHLIAVRRDFTGFQHVHPDLDPEGTWATRLDLTPGQWRLFADFEATGADAVTLGADLAVAGDYQPLPATGESRTARVAEYTVTLDGNLTAGSDAKLTLSVRKGGEPVTELQPYLDAYGHLVTLRAGDLAYLHVHPDGEPGDGTTEPGPDVTFYASVPSTGTYHLYLDFKHQGVVRTAAFSVTAADSSEQTPPAADNDDHADH